MACKVAAFILDQSPPIGHDTRTGVPGTQAEEARQGMGLVTRGRDTGRGMREASHRSEHAGGEPVGERGS